MRYLSFCVLVTCAILVVSQAKQSSVNSAVGYVPTGAIMAFGAGSCPTGWVAADGTAKATASYPALDSYFGTTWGARSGGNFQIPNLNGDGRYLRGGAAGTLQAFTTSAVDLSTSASSISGTAAAQTFAGTSHGHGLNYALPHDWSGSGGCDRNTNVVAYSCANYQSVAATTAGGTNSASSVSGTAAAQAISGAAETRPVTAVVNYCIKV